MPEIYPPVGGLRRSNGYQRESPYFFTKGKNVRGFDVIEGRGRLGSRPGLARQFQTQLGGGNPVRMAAVLRTFNDRGVTSFADSFPGSAMSADWTAGSFTVNGQAVSGGLPDVSGGAAKLPAGSTSLVRSAILTGVAGYLNTGYREVTIVPPGGSPNVNETYHLYLDLNSASLSESTGVVARISGTSGLLLSVTISVNGVDVVLGSNQSNSVGPILFLKLSIDESNRIRVTWNNGGTGVEYVATGYSAPVSADCRAGFALHRDNNSLCEANSFSLTYISTSGGTPPEAWVGADNGHLYRESTTGALEKVTTGADASPPTAGANISLASDRVLEAANILEKLYIADYGIKHVRKVKHANATVTNVSGTQAILDDSDVASWNAKLIDPLTDYLVVLATTETVPSAAPAVSIGVYSIVSVHDTNGVTFNRSNAWTASAVAYYICRAPKVYDAALNTFALIGLGTLGTAQPPMGCRSVVRWAGKLVWMGHDLYPHGFWISAINAPLLYDYGDSGTVGENGLTTDVPLLTLGENAAVDGTQREFAGLIGEPNVCGIPYSDERLIIGCRTSFYYMLGNIRAGGKIFNITGDVGILGEQAWARTDDDRVFAMTPLGLYEIRPQENGATPISRDTLPKELMGLTADRYQVTVSFDAANRWIVIGAASKIDGAGSVHYIFDLRTNGFYPDERDSSKDAFCRVSYQPGGVALPVATMGGRDGYVYRFDDAAVNDDSLPFEPDAYVGPLILGADAMTAGFLDDFTATLDEQSGDVTVEIYTGHSPQDALKGPAKWSCLLRAGANRVFSPNLYDFCAYIRFIGAPCEFWALESASFTRRAVGKKVLRR